MPARRSIGCIGSKVAFLCGVVCFSTCLTGWVNRTVFGFLLVLLLFLLFLFLLLLTLLFGFEVLASLFLFPGFFLYLSVCSRCFFQQYTLISVMSWILQWWHVGLDLSASVFVGCCFTLFICSSSGASKPFSSKSLPRCVAICSNVPFSRWV